MTDEIDQFMEATTEVVGNHKDHIAQLQERLEALENGRPTASAGRGRVTEPDDLPGGTSDRPRGQAKVLGHASRHSDTLGFRSFGEFAMSVQAAGVRGGTQDERLMAAAASTWGNEASGADGGFAVPPDFRNSIMEKAFSEDSLIGRCDQVSVMGNSLTIPSDMTTPWGTDGIRAFWEAEASAITQSKPKIEEVNLRLHKLAALVPVTEELLEDASAMGSYVSRKAGQKIDFELSRVIARGTGVGQPLGYMNSPALIVQAAETSQVADTIVSLNVTGMSSHLPPESRRTAIWLVHPDAEPQLQHMTVGDTPIFMPAGGLSDAPFGRLLGRPVIPHQVTSTVGDQGDIMLVDLSQYLMAVKAGGVRSQTSIHVWFDQDLVAFKFTVRVAGQPWWSATTSSRDGNHEMSPFVTLAARA